MSFDALAPHYRWMETVLAGPVLQRCRTRYLDQLGAARRVLVLGPGRGRFVLALLAAVPQARLTLVDSSRGMLDRIERDVRALGAAADRVSLVHADVRIWRPAVARYDAVASHFFLDCFAPEELGALITRVAGWLAPEALWVLSDFRVPERGWRRRRALAIHALMYAVFRRLTDISARAVSPPDAVLTHAGFELAGRETFNHGLVHTDLWRRVAPDCGPAVRGESGRRGVLSHRVADRGLLR